jgi:hypothetical protein
MWMEWTRGRISPVTTQDGIYDASGSVDSYAEYAVLIEIQKHCIFQVKERQMPEQYRNISAELLPWRQKTAIITPVLLPY